MTDCKHIENPCYKEQEKKEVIDIGEDFQACLPFGAYISLSNGRLAYAGPNTTRVPDGVYTQFTVQSGCIIAAGQADISTYTSTPCAPVPNPCDCGGGGGTGAVVLSPSQPNLSYWDEGGRLLTQLFVTAGPGIQLRGTGARGNPLIISVAENTAGGSSTTGSVYFSSVDSSLAVSGTGTASDPFNIYHTTRAQGSRYINGMSFDAAGHLVDYSEPSAAENAVTGIIAGTGIEVDRNMKTGIVTVSLAKPLHPINQTYTLGNYNVTFDEYNRVYDIKAVSGGSGSGDGDDGDTTIDGYGTVFCRQIHAAQAVDNTEQIIVNTTKSGHFKVSVDGAPSMGDIGVRVSGRTVPCISSGGGHVVGMTTSSQPAGRHTVTITGALAVNTVITIEVVQSV